MKRKVALAGALLVALRCGAADDAAREIRINQVGFAPAAQKIAVVPDGAATGFSVIDSAGKTVLQGKLGAPAVWEASAEQVRLADLSPLKTAGSYRLRVDGLADSAPFTVAESPYKTLNAASIRAFYFNRASIALTPEFAGVYARAAGHPDDKVLVHASAASSTRPTGTVIASPKGWYDAGDYNKYVVNSGISTYTLLAAYEHYPAYFGQQSVKLPESGNGIPDILNEALWNLDRMLSMQDPADGGVYHKLTNLSFDGVVMPDQARTPRYVVQKGTAAALDFAAVMAVASRVMAPYEAQRPGLSARMLAAAEAAWKWAKANPARSYQQPADVFTGGYGDKSLADEFAWAAAELYISSGKGGYYAAFSEDQARLDTPGWGNVRTLGWISLAHHLQRLGPEADRARIAAGITALAGQLRTEWNSSAYKVAMKKSDFVWGSNAVALNQGMVLLQAYRLNGPADDLRAAQSALDYVLGRNATGYSFVTGFGARSPMHPHHRPSEADKVAAPVPGFVVGGPQAGQQDKAGCRKPYQSALPAKSYLDEHCSYASNEVAINWNAPLVYLSAGLDALTH
ncbi:MAG: glycoside hydrolase family 9 protein [Massilia sp.]